MKLITTEQHTQLLANGCAALEAARADREIDPTPVVKLFTPGGYARYLLTEIDPIDSDRAYGLCDLGMGHPELGYVSLRELEDVRDKLGLRVERDLNFVADKPLSAYAAVAYMRGLIIT
jgi:Protein of unknown function (DUF2958)